MVVTIESTEDLRNMIVNDESPLILMAHSPLQIGRNRVFWDARIASYERRFKIRFATMDVDNPENSAARASLLPDAGLKIHPAFLMKKANEDVFYRMNSTSADSVVVRARVQKAASFLAYPQDFPNGIDFNFHL